MKLLVCFLLFAATACTHVYAVEKEASDLVTKKQAVELALDNYAGRTLKITENTDSYVVRILQNDGHVVDIRVDKKTGTVKKD
jgi:uncharacterized membrane protein YkoI